MRKGERRIGQLDQKVETSQQGRKQERQSNPNPKLIHNNLGVHKEERDWEVWCQTRTGDDFCTFHRLATHRTKDCVVMRKCITELADVGKFEQMVAEELETNRLQRVLSDNRRSRSLEHKLEAAKIIEAGCL